MWDQNSGIEEAIKIRHLSRGYSKIFRPLEIFFWKGSRRPSRGTDEREDKWLQKECCRKGGCGRDC